MINLNSSQTFSIKKEEFDASGSTAPSIAILAFIEIPLEFNLSDDINMNLLSMAGITDSGTDLLQREGPPDEADKLEFLDAIRSVKINYSSSTLPFYGIPGVSLILDLRLHICHQLCLNPTSRIVDGTQRIIISMKLRLYNRSIN